MHLLRLVALLTLFALPQSPSPPLEKLDMIRPGLADKSPSLAFDSDGRLWLARVAMEESADVIAVRSRTGQDWSGDFTVARGTVGAPRLVTQDASLWVFWHEQRAGNWDIFARQFDGSRWQPERRITAAPGAELHPTLAREGGRVWVAYESIDAAGFAIGVRVLEQDRWSPPARLAADIPRSIERRPTIAGASDGGIWLAWDSTRTGNPDIFLAQVRSGGSGAEPAASPAIQVTADASIDDTPSLTVDPRDGTMWIAWNGMRGHAHDPLRTDQHSGDAYVRAYREGTWLTPPSPHTGALPGQVSAGAVNKTPRDAVDPYWHWKQTQNYPAIALDAQRRVWIVWRTDATGAHNFDLWARRYDGAAWSPELHLTTPYPGRDEWPAFALDTAGELWMAWEGQSDAISAGRPPLGPGDVDAFNSRAAPNTVYVAQLPSGAMPSTPAPLREAPSDVFRPAEVRTLPIPGPPAGGVPADDARFRIYFGDPHMHSVLSDAKAGHPDQLLFLARDRSGLDYGVVSDHAEMGRLQHGEYAEILLLARLFTEPGRFLSFSGFEWTAGATYGHRVILFEGDEAPQLASSTPEGEHIESLYALARRHKGVMSPHHTGQATWGRWNPDYHDAEVEPNFEIASWHGRFEFYGNPWEGRRQVPGHQYQDQLRRGRKVGVMGASDTHHLQPGQGGLTAVLAEELSRPSLFEAVRRRRVYATTGDKIVLEFTADGAPMGSEIEAAGAVALRVRVEGTGALDRVEIVKDLVDTFAAVRLEQNPTGPDGVFMVYDPAAPQGGTRLALDDTSRLRVSAEDAGASGREHVYYVRVTQANGQQAWSSPIWVRFK